MEKRHMTHEVDPSQPNYIIRDDYGFMNDSPDPFAKLAKLAARLGVKPRQSNDPASIVAVTKSGQTYDLIEIAFSLLDRMDAHADIIASQVAGNLSRKGQP
jgi:hypothetical protein